MADTHIKCYHCKNSHFDVFLSSNRDSQHDYIKLTCYHCGNEQLYVVDLSPEFERFMEEIGL